MQKAGSLSEFIRKRDEILRTALVNTCITERETIRVRKNRVMQGV